MRKKIAAFFLFSTKMGILLLNMFPTCSLQTCEQGIGQDQTWHTGPAHLCVCVNCVFFSLTGNGTQYKSIKASYQKGKEPPSSPAKGLIRRRLWVPA